MRNLVIALAGFLFGGAIVGLALALPPRTITVTQTPAVTAMPMSASRGSSMMATAASPATRKLTIQHAQRGCHVWSDGKTTATMMRLHLQPGQKLSILDMDVDAHQMMEFAGPAHLLLGGPMMMNHRLTIAFPRKGVYRLGTKTVEMPGSTMMDVKTIGPDNQLRLVVTVS